MAALNASFAELDGIYHVNRDCCPPGSPAGCTDEITPVANCTMIVLRPGFRSPAAAPECSDVRLKREVVALGLSASGVPMFSWRYRDGHGLDSSRRYRGTTAQALLVVGRADAVVANGCGGEHFAVAYERLPDVPFGPLL